MQTMLSVVVVSKCSLVLMTVIEDAGSESSLPGNPETFILPSSLSVNHHVTMFLLMPK